MFSLVVLTAFAGHDDHQWQTDIFLTSFLFEMVFWHGLHDAIGWASGAIIQESSCPVKHPPFAVPKHGLRMQFVLKRNLLGRFWRSFQLLHRFAA